MRDWDDSCEPPRKPRPELKHRWSYRGDSLVVDFQVFSTPAFSPPCTPGSPVNITGWTFWFTAKYHYADPDQQAVAQITNTTSVPAGGGLVVVDALSGKGEFSVPPIATRGFPDGDVRLRYDIQGKDTSGRIFTVEEGVWDVWPDVTNAIA